PAAVFLLFSAITASPADSSAPFRNHTRTVVLPTFRGSLHGLELSGTVQFLPSWRLAVFCVSSFARAPHLNWGGGWSVAIKIGFYNNEHQILMESYLCGIPIEDGWLLARRGPLHMQAVTTVPAGASCVSFRIGQSSLITSRVQLKQSR